MENEDVVLTLEKLGWRCLKDEAGDFFCLANVSDVLVQVIPSVAKRSGYFRF